MIPSSRFALYFPYVTQVLHNPAMSAIALLPVAGLAGIWSVHYGLAVVLGWLVLVAFYLERRVLEFCLFPPFATVILWQFLGLGVGVSLITADAGAEFNPAFLRMQLVWIIGFPVFYLAHNLFFGRLRQVVVPIPENPIQSDAWRPLYIIGWIVFVFRVVGYMTGAISGSEDRGFHNVVASQDATFGIWTVFQLMPRFTNVGFILLPVLFTRSGPMGRVVLVALTSVFFVLALVSGGRGNVFYPLIFIITGFYAFKRMPRVRLDVVMMSLAVVFIPLIFFIGTYRGTEGFVNTRMSDVKGRILAMQETGALMKEESSSSGGMTITGTALVGVSDRLVYESTPLILPHARWENIDAIVYTWIPSFFMPGKPILIDGNDIVSQYLEYDIGRSTGATISLPADLFRRFGWGGVALGMPLAFLVYGAVSYFCYWVYLYRNFTAGVVLVLYTVSFFSWSPLQTVLTTWWTFAYDFPRHILALLGLLVVASTMGGRAMNRGALYFWPAHLRAETPRGGAAKGVK